MSWNYRSNPKMQPPKRRLKEDDSYFYEDDPYAQKSNKIQKQQKNEHEIDPLDAFMCAIDSTASQQIKKAKIDAKIEEKSKFDPKTGKIVKQGKLTSSQKIAAENENVSKKKSKNIREDLEKQDSEEEYYNWVEANPDKACPEFDKFGNLIRKIPENQKNSKNPSKKSVLSEEAINHLENEDESEVITFDDDGNVHVNTKKKDISALPVVYHSQKNYLEFKKNFYFNNEHSSISNLSQEEVEDLRSKLDIKVISNEPCPKPICSFAHLQHVIPTDLMNIIKKQKFTSPTGIQSQALPAAFSGRDVIGIAKTGSGKTLAFSWPVIIHAAAQSRRPRVRIEGELISSPIAVILSPTRELCIQTYEDLKLYCSSFNLRPLPLYGGGNLWEQARHCKIKRPEIVIGTPGRIMDLVTKKHIVLDNVTFLCIDEADRMFDMGFEYQIRSICNAIRPDRQALLFSATFPKKIQDLVKDILQSNYIKIISGSGPGQINKNIQQTVKIIQNFQGKIDFLNFKFVELTSEGGVLIFVTKKEDAEKVGKILRDYHKERPGMKVGILHGDMTQFIRNQVLHDFRLRKTACLVATDVCARGLDISHIKNVICMTAARNIDTYVHRVGRTGRADQLGKAILLIDENDNNDISFIRDLRHYLSKSCGFNNTDVPKELNTMITESAWRENVLKEENLKRFVDGKLNKDFDIRQEQLLLGQKSQRKYDFRYEFVLPGFQLNQETLSGKSNASNKNDTSAKKYMGSFVRATETQKALTKEKAAEMMANNKS